MELEVKQQGPNGWVAAGVGLLMSCAAILIALAVWQFSVYVGVGVLLVCGGEGMRRACFGIAAVIRQRGEAQASIIRAQGETGQLEPPRRPELVEGESWRR